MSEPEQPPQRRRGRHKSTIAIYALINVAAAAVLTLLLHLWRSWSDALSMGIAALIAWCLLDVVRAAARRRR